MELMREWSSRRISSKEESMRLRPSTFTFEFMSFTNPDDINLLDSSSFLLLLLVLFLGLAHKTKLELLK